MKKMFFHIELFKVLRLFTFPRFQDNGTTILKPKRFTAMEMSKCVL